MSKVCATRKSKAHPNVYTVSELKKLAIKKGHSTKTVNVLKKNELCKLLNIKWKGKDTTKSKNKDTKATKDPNIVKDLKATKDLGVWGCRECLAVKSKKNPNAFTKKELVALATKHLKLKKTDISMLRKGQLCFLLKAAGVQVPKATGPKPKKTSTKTGTKPEKTGIKPKKTGTKPEKVSTKTGTKPKKVSTKTGIKPKKTSTKKVKVSAKKEKVKTTTKKEKKKKIVGVPEDCVEGSKLQLRQHQKTLVKHLQTNRGVIAAFDVGTGKTLTAVTASQCYLKNNPKGKVVVVTPVSLVENFKKEIRAYGADPNDKRYKFYTMRKFALSYHGKKCKSNVMLIIDEAHNLRNIKKKSTISATTEAIKCAQGAGKVLLMTATPVVNDPADILPLVAMIKGTEPLTPKTIGRMTPEEQCDYFRDTIMFFSNPKTKDYPTVTEHTIREKMSKEYYAKYRDVEQLRDKDWDASNPWRFLTGMRIATNRLEPCLKCTWTVNKIKEGEKTVVYSAFLTYGVHKIQEMLKADNIKFVEITGKLSQAERQKAVEQYNGNKVNVLFITKAGGEGLDLKGTKNVILLEKSWNRATEEQIMGRAARYKSHTHLPENKQHVDVYHLMIVKPELKDDDDLKQRPSADEILDQLTKAKMHENKVLLDLLKTAAIDSKTKCPPKNHVRILFKEKGGSAGDKKDRKAKYLVKLSFSLQHFEQVKKKQKDIENVIKERKGAEITIVFKKYIGTIEFSVNAKVGVKTITKNIDQIIRKSKGGVDAEWVKDDTEYHYKMRM